MYYSTYFKLSAAADNDFNISVQVKLSLGSTLIWYNFFKCDLDAIFFANGLMPNVFYTVKEILIVYVLVQSHDSGQY